MKKLRIGSIAASGRPSRSCAGARALAFGGGVRTARRAAVPGFLLALAACSEASAAWVGDRYFPSTLATTVPTAADFFNPPSYVRLPKIAPTPTPSTRETDIPTTYSKLITSDWGVTFTETYRIVEQANAPTRSGFDNFVIGTQYHLYVNPQHQFIFTVGGTAAIGGTGSSKVANSFSTLTPTIYIGKGFGDLPASMAWLRPVNVTANVGVALPTQSTTLSTSGTAVTETVNPTNLLWSFALEYTQLTTNSYYGSDGKVRRFPRGWVPLVEFALTTPLNGPNAGLTTGTVNPGVIWVGRYLQFGVEAIVPVNARSGRDVGVRAQAHLYLSEIFPDTIGKPIFGK
jgi:hypothetical protein